MLKFYLQLQITAIPPAFRLTKNLELHLNHTIEHDKTTYHKKNYVTENLAQYLDLITKVSLQ